MCFIMFCCFSATDDDRRFVGMTRSEQEEMLRRCDVAQKEIDLMRIQCEQMDVECMNDDVYVNR